MASQELALSGGEPIRKAGYPDWPRLGPGDLDRIREVLESNYWGGENPSVRSFAELFAQFHDARFGIAVSSGSMALELALHSAGIGKGDEVIVPAHSFIATATAVSRVGAEPVFVDVDGDSFNIDSAQAAEAICDKTRAIIPVHFGGVMAEMDRLADIASSNGLMLLEDAAHAHGAEWYGTRAGGLGRAGIFSFQNSKAMTAGEGGIVITSDESLAETAHSITNAGRHPEGGWFEHFELGTNLRMTAPQAAVLLAQLERLPHEIQLRATNFARFEEELGEVEGIALQKAPAGATAQTRYILPGRIMEKQFGGDRDRFVEALQAEGVPVRPFYPHPLYANPVFGEWPHRKLQCPVAEQLTRDSFWIPMRVFMASESDAADAGRAIAKVHQALKPSRRSFTNGLPAA